MSLFATQNVFRSSKCALLHSFTKGTRAHAYLIYARRSFCKSYVHKHAVLRAR